MNSTRSSSAGGYRRTKSPNSTGASRYQEQMGPGSVTGLYQWLNAEVKAGRMTPGEKQKRIWAGV